MPDQTLPDFLFSVITEQRKSVSTLVDALNEAKNGINQLSVSAERSEESRRQVETLLERQSTVESDLKFDLTQCRQQNEILQGQVKTLEENLERAEKLLFVVTGERDGLSDNYQSLHDELQRVRNECVRLKNQRDGTERTCGILHDAYSRLRAILGAETLPQDMPITSENVHAYVEQRARDLVDFRGKVINSPNVAWMSAAKDVTHFSQYKEDDIPLIVAPTLAAGTLDCAVPTANADLPDDYEVN